MSGMKLRNPDDQAPFVTVTREVMPGTLRTPKAGLLAIFREMAKRSSGASDGAFYLGNPDGQTILAFDPYETVRIRGGRARIENAGGSFELSGNPFTIISDRMDYYRSGAVNRSMNSAESGFRGGALGYFAYESVRFIEPILQSVGGCLNQLSGNSDAEFMFFRRLIIFKGREIRRIVSGYFPKSQAEGLRDSQAEIEEMIQICLDSNPGPRKGNSPELDFDKMKPSLGKEKFLAAVKKLKSHIKNGDIFQAVLSDRFRIPFQGNTIDLFESLTVSNPSTYQFYFKSGKKTFLGASPEMLLKISNETLEDASDSGHPTPWKKRIR